MKSSLLVSLAAAATLAFAADGPPKTATPPVLRPMEPADSVVLRLPGPPRSPRPSGRSKSPSQCPNGLPWRRNSPCRNFRPCLSFRPPTRPSTHPSDPAPTAKSPVPESAVPLPPAPPVLPAEATQEMAFYCQKRIGHSTSPMPVSCWDRRCAAAPPSTSTRSPTAEFTLSTIRAANTANWNSISMPGPAVCARSSSIRRV